MSARRSVWEVARREIVERSRSRVMRVSVVLLLILSIGGAIAAARLTGQTPTDNIALVGARSVGLEPAIQQQAKQAGRRAKLRVTLSAPAASRLLRDGKVDVALIDGSRILVKSSKSQPAVRVVQDAVASRQVFDRLRGAGLSTTQVLAALSPTPLPIGVLELNTRNTERNRTMVLIGLIGLFMVLIFYGQAVAQGVTEEKSSRVVELLLTSVSPRRLLTGKVLGIGLLGLAQVLLAGGAALLAGRLAGGAGLPSAAPATVALVLLWFVLGYAFYSVAFAAVGALVSRQEDLSTAIVPITVVMTGSFYLAMIIAGSNPDGTVAQISAFVPPFSSMVAPARMVLGTMSVLELAVAVAVDLIATAGLVVLAARIYQRAILRIGAPVKLRRLFTVGREPGGGVASDRYARAVDVGGRIVAIAFMLGGVAIGFGQPVSIALILAGVLVVAALERRKRHPPHGTV